MGRDQGLVSPRGEISVRAGRALPHGFVLVLEWGGKRYRAEVGREVVLKEEEKRREGLWWDLLFGLGVPPRFHLPFTLLALGFLVYGLFLKEERLVLAFLASGAFAGLVARWDGSARWHSLEHKSIWVLEGGAPRDAASLKEALKKAPPYHPRCGSVDMALTALFSGGLAFILPASLALVLGVAAAEGVQRLGLPLWLVRPVQAPFLLPPREEEVELAAWGLAEILQVADQDEVLQGVEEAPA